MANRFSCHGEDNHLVAFAVCHDGCVTKGIGKVVGFVTVGEAGFVAVTVGNELFCAPGCAVVFGDAHLDIYFSIADVTSAGTVVGNSHHVAVECCGDGGNAIGLAVGAGCGEDDAIFVGAVVEGEYGVGGRREVGERGGFSVEERLAVEAAVGEGRGCEGSVFIEIDLLSVHAACRVLCGLSDGIGEVCSVCADGDVCNGIVLKGSALDVDGQRDGVLRVNHGEDPAAAIVTAAIEFQVVGDATVRVETLSWCSDRFNGVAGVGGGRGVVCQCPGLRPAGFIGSGKCDRFIFGG